MVPVSHCQDPECAAIASRLIAQHSNTQPAKTFMDRSLPRLRGKVYLFGLLLPAAPLEAMASVAGFSKLSVSWE